MNDQVLGKSLVTILTALALSATACSSDREKGIQGGDSPDLVTDVNEIMFVEVAVNETDTQTLTVFNVGKGELKISAIELVEETLDDAGAEFEKGPNWVGALNLATDEQLQITVNYTPRDKQADRGFIVLRTNDPKYAEGIAKIPLKSPSLAPRIFSKENVIFRRVPPVDETTRDKYWQLTEVQNIGQAALTVTDIIVTPRESDFHISFPAAFDAELDPADDGDSFPGLVEPGESFPVRVYFNPLDDLPSTAEMILYSNDAEAPEYVVNLLGNSGSPCLQLSEEGEINFGEGAIGHANNKTLVVENCSPTAELTISEIDVCTMNTAGDCDASLDTFSIRDNSLPGDLPDDVAVLGPQQTANFVLTYTPDDTSVSNGQLVISSDDPAKSMLTVPIVGKGTDNACPTAVAEATIAGVNRYQTEINTVPLNTVNFRGTNSIDSDGTVQSYEWTIVQQPTGSTTRMTPSAASPEPSLFIDLAGDYVIELKVFDDRGTESCGEQAIITISAVPNEAVHVQLVWDTPADPDQTDTFGTDLDLHFLHPNGNWNSSPWDCYWLNKTADWGRPGDPSDDPSLDIDDTDGAGPENINLDEPEAGVAYEVGVYYFSDWGMGPSYATVRVYIDGVQQFEQEQLLQSSGSFWRTARVLDRVVTPIDTVHNDFP